MDIRSAFLTIVIYIVIVTQSVLSNEEFISDKITGEEKNQAEMIGSIKYRQSRVMIYQSTQKNNEFYFTPLPSIQTNTSQCREDLFTGKIELIIHIDLYATHLKDSVKDYLMKHRQSVCGGTKSTFSCEFSLIPMNLVRLFEKSQHFYHLDNNWLTASYLEQSKDFAISVSNRTACEQLQQALTDRCQLGQLEFHYTVGGETTVERTINVTTEHVTTTLLYNKLVERLPAANRVLLEKTDFRRLITESLNLIVVSLRLDKNFKQLEQPDLIEQRLIQHLSVQEVSLIEHA